MDDGMERLRAMLEMPSYLLRNFRPKEHAAAYRQWLERYGPLLGIQPGEIDVTDEELMRVALRREAEREAARAEVVAEPKNRWTYCGHCGIRRDEARPGHQDGCLSHFVAFENLSEELQVAVARRYLPPDVAEEQAEAVTPIEEILENLHRVTYQGPEVAEERAEGYGPPEVDEAEGDDETEPAKRDPLGELRARMRTLKSVSVSYERLYRVVSERADAYAKLVHDALDQRDAALEEKQKAELARDAAEQHVAVMERQNVDLRGRILPLMRDREMLRAALDRRDAALEEKQKAEGDHAATVADLRANRDQLRELVGRLGSERDALRRDIQRQSAHLNRTAGRLHRKEQAIEAVLNGMRCALDLFAQPRPYWTRRQFFDWMRDLEDALRYGLSRYETHQEELSANEAEVAPLPEPYDDGIPEERFVEGDVYANSEQAQRSMARELGDSRLDALIDQRLR